MSFDLSSIWDRPSFYLAIISFIVMISSSFLSRFGIGLSSMQKIERPGQNTDEDKYVSVGTNWIRYINYLSIIGLIVGIMWFAYDMADLVMSITSTESFKTSGDAGADFEKLKETLLVFKYEGDKAVSHIAELMQISLRKYIIVANAMGKTVSGIPDINIKPVPLPAINKIKISIGAVPWKAIYNKLLDTAKKVADAAKKAAEAAKKAANEAANAAKKAKFW